MPGVEIGHSGRNRKHCGVLKHLFGSVVSLFSCCILIFLSGCAAMIEASIRDKTDSIENAPISQRDMEWLVAWVQENTSFAFSGASGVRIMGSEEVANEYIVQIVGERPAIGGGLAAAVSEEGYYITASHVLEEGVPILLVHNEAGRLRYELVREVWRAADGRDLALLKGQQRRTCFALATKTPAVGEVVLAAGASGGDSAGVILEVDDEHVLHTAPLRRGDSGGPLINSKGELIGVNRAIHLDPFHGRRNEASILDSNEILRQIRSDRWRRKKVSRL
jgi:S1-C subfamily serine protease